jgi:hypothetical protein
VIERDSRGLWFWPANLELFVVVTDISADVLCSDIRILRSLFCRHTDTPPKLKASLDPQGWAVSKQHTIINI